MMFFVVIDNHWFSRVDETGAYLIDRCGAYVTPIINYLRHGQLVVDDSVNPAGVLEEARFFGITSIIPQLEQLVQVFIHIVRKFVQGVRTNSLVCQTLFSWRYILVIHKQSLISWYRYNIVWNLYQSFTFFFLK